jgi:hypothetical protein
MKSAKIALAWMVVCIPLAWGVASSVRKALPLFKAVPSAAAQPAASK